MIVDLDCFDLPVPELWTAIDARTPQQHIDILGNYDAWAKARQGRDTFTTQYAWAIPSREAVVAIVSHVGDRRLLEVGAGTGLWARLLDDAGVKVTATDNYHWSVAGRKAGRPRPYMRVGLYYDVARMGAERAVRQHPDHKALMICWPPYNEPMAARALKAFTGDRLVYIGEADGGCNGDKAFHTMLGSGLCNCDDMDCWDGSVCKHNDVPWVLTHTVALPQWPGIHDSLWLYQLKGRG